MSPARPSEPRPSDRNHALTDREQELSDRDQVLSDREQALSDRDQKASDADQVASDLDWADGSVSEACHQRSSAARVEGTRGRLEAGSLRDEASSQRDTVAHARDDLAAVLDHDADLHDQAAGDLDQRDELLDKRTLRVQDLRARASMARTRAAEDRDRARRDRERAARDRELAACDRDQAARQWRQAGTDELTGTRRRGVGLEELENEIERARRTGGSLVAVYVDVDGLKSVNDALGHHAGDALLCEVADALKRHMRSYDLVVRLGGDEFLCALPDVSLEEAHSRVNHLNAELHRGPSAGSVSTGFAELRGDDSKESLVDRADRELLANRAGRAPRGVISPARYMQAG